MLIGVVSDTHNNQRNIKKIIEEFNDRNVSFVFHTGDIANSKSLEYFERLKCSLCCVYGNNDRNEVGLDTIAEKYGFQIHLPPIVVTLNNRKIAVFHEPDIINEFLNENKDIDLVLHGHTHRYRLEKIQDVMVFNPGESAGWIEGKNAIGIINLDDLSSQRIFF